jgi:hypothetical protein
VYPSPIHDMDCRSHGGSPMYVASIPRTGSSSAARGVINRLELVNVLSILTNEELTRVMERD